MYPQCAFVLLFRKIAYLYGSVMLYLCDCVLCPYPCFLDKHSKEFWPLQLRQQVLLHHQTFGILDLEYNIRKTIERHQELKTL